MTEKQDRIFKLAATGANRLEIAKVLGVSYTYVSTTLRGVHPTVSKRTPREKIAEIRRLQLLGYTPKRIAHEVDCQLKTVYAHLRKEPPTSVRLPYEFQTRKPFIAATNEQRGIWLRLYAECLQANVSHLSRTIEPSPLYWYEGDKLRVWGIE